MKIFKERKNAELPKFATEGSACFDVVACLDVGDGITTYNPHQKKIVNPVKNSRNGPVFAVQPQFRALIPTGLIFNVPSGHVIKMYPRSGMSLKFGITLANNVGVIDSDYVEETFVILYNISDTPVSIFHGDRIAQAMLEKTINYEIEEAKRKPYQKSERNSGFGSTGIHSEEVEKTFSETS